MSQDPLAPLMPAVSPAPSTRPVATQSPPPGISPKEDQALHASARSFEAMFLDQMFQEMNADTPVDKVFGGGNGEKMYRSMLFDQYSKVASGRGGFGIANAIYRELLHMQEKAQGIHPAGAAS